LLKRTSHPFIPKLRFLGLEIEAEPRDFQADYTFNSAACSHPAPR
jgi:hypothetical protein